MFLTKSFITFLLFHDQKTFRYALLKFITRLSSVSWADPEKSGGSVRNLNGVQSFTWKFQICDSRANKEMQINVNGTACFNERDAVWTHWGELAQSRLFAFICWNWTRHYANVRVTKPRGVPTGWAPKCSRPTATARLLRLCSIARANVRCTISSLSTRRSCIPSHMHHNALSQRAFSKCPHRLRARTLMARNQSVLNVRRRVHKMYAFRRDLRTSSFIFCFC